MKEDLYQKGQLVKLHSGAFLSDWKHLDYEQTAEVVCMDHRFGRNRYVVIQLFDVHNTQVTVYPHQVSEFV